jgi:transcriptional regulator with XRE-family HTH domain
MLSVDLFSSDTIAKELARRVRRRRLNVNLSQEGVANRSGVTLASVKRFEQTGLISLDSLIRIAFVIDGAEEFNNLFQPKAFQTIQDVIGPAHSRARGTRT